eukprot:755127-Pyramimonas_sp.AAC.1
MGAAGHNRRGTVPLPCSTSTLAHLRYARALPRLAFGLPCPIALPPAPPAPPLLPPPLPPPPRPPRPSPPPPSHDSALRPPPSPT